MKKCVFLALLAITLPLQASNPPLSGTFSNMKQADTGGFSSSIKNMVNLVVTTNNKGQQFFIQCYSAGKMGFGVLTTFKKPQLTAKINAGAECPAIEMMVELDYENAIIRFNKDWIYLPRGEIQVPLIEGGLEKP